MADRIHSYPMFSQNLNPNSLQQPQIPQQPPQSQQPDPQMISALSNPEHARMWQQMNPLQNQYRPQQSGDLTASQMNHQMQEFARGQALPHGQGQPIVQQIQQTFGLNAQRMNPSGPVFHDSQGNQPQSLMPTNFSGMPMNTQQQVKASFNMNPMMRAAMSNPGVSHQIKMQEMARFQQSGLGAQHVPNQPTAVDMFASPPMQPSQDQMHGSPHPAAQPGGPPGASQAMVPGNQQSTVQKRMMTPTEFQERRNYLFNLIQQSDNNLAALMQATRNTNVEPHVQQKLAQLRAELAGRKEMYTKFVATYGAMVTQQMANSMPASHVNPMAHPAPPQPQQVPMSNAQVQPGFVAQTSQAVNAPYKFPTGNGPSPMTTQNHGPLNQQLPIQPTPIGRPNTIPPRTAGTPHQLAGSMSPSLGNFGVPGVNGQKVPEQTRQSAGVMPLDKQRFETTYAQFCRSQNISTTGTGSHVQIGDRTVDLHQLHVQVMHEGGAASVTQRDMWAVIGGRLNIIQFPGTETEPARCGPGIAQQLHNIYDRYLQHFENAYIITVKNRPAAMSPQQSLHPMNSSPLAIANNTTPGMPGNTAEIPANPPRPLPNANQQLVAAALRYVLSTPQDMRAQRVPEHMIGFVERYRPELMKLYHQQLQMVTKRNAEQEQQGMANSQGQLPNIHEQASVGLQPGVQRPPQVMGANPMVGENKMGNASFMSEAVVAALPKQPPTQDQIQHAMVTIGQIKQAFQQRLLAITSQHIPEEQRPGYNQILEHVYKMTVDLEAKLPLYFAFFKHDDVLRKYVAIVLTVARQRHLLSASPPQYIINPPTLRNMQMQIQRLNEEFESRWRAIKTAAAVANSQHASLTPTPARINPSSSLSVPPMHNISISQVAPAPQNNGRPPSIAPQQLPPPQPPIHPTPQPPSQSQPSQIQPHPQQQPMLHHIKKNFQSPVPPSDSAPSVPVALASPTPPPAVATASSSTPATSAPTPQPTHSSPQTPKSPPLRATGKAKASSRVNRKMSTASRGPVTPEMTPSVAGVKRPPEEDVAATLTSIVPSEAEASNAPSPKKAKTEWEGEASEALVKKQQEIENIKTDEDAAAFFDCMKELFAMTASTDNEIHHDIASTLNQILAGVAQEPADAAATAAALSAHGAGDAGPPPTALSPHLGPANDAFLEFIDFSSFTTLDDEDNDSKAPTPDLIPSSEANPSPESGSEGDSLGGSGSPDKTKMDEPSDLLRLGSLREIDGGESAYYQAGDWKWEGQMPTLDQPWAIFTS